MLKRKNFGKYGTLEFLGKMFTLNALSILLSNEMRSYFKSLPTIPFAKKKRKYEGKKSACKKINFHQINKCNSKRKKMV